MKKKPLKKATKAVTTPIGLRPTDEGKQPLRHEYECWARTAIRGKDENAAEQLLEAVEGLFYWFSKVEKAGIYKERIKRAVAWPSIISLQPKDPRYHKAVVSDLKKRGLGSLALTGRNNRSGGRRGVTVRDWANLIHGVIFIIKGLAKLPVAKLGGYVDGPHSWDTSNVVGEIKFSVDFVLFSCPELIALIKSQPSLTPSEELWRTVGEPILFALRNDLVPQKSGRRKKGASCIDSAARRQRAAIRRAYIELANVDNKSHFNVQKDDKSKKRKRRRLT